MLMRNRSFPTLHERSGNTPDRFSDLLDNFFDEAFGLNRSGFMPELNVYETEDTFEVTCELPGMSKEDIEISFENNRLIISGERKARSEDEKHKFHRVESRFGSFSRALPLPDTIDSENIEAAYDNGVLSVEIPKLEERKTGKQIKVK